MSLREAAPTLVPRAPALPFKYHPPPLSWAFEPLYEPSKPSRHRQLHCSGVEIATHRGPDKDSKLEAVVILDIRYFAPEPARGEFVKLVIGGKDLSTHVLDAHNLSGVSYIWGFCAADDVKGKLDITLQVVYKDEICDELSIGVLSSTVPESPPVAKKPTKKRRTSHSSRKKSPSLERRAAATADLDTARELFHGPVALAGYTRVQLKVIGDLCKAEKEWTEAERKEGRRLIRFYRTQLGALIHLESATAETAFDPKRPSVVISCIQWQTEPKAFFVTSFDVIRLVEFALQTRMTTEIKSRARRNMASVFPTTLERVELPDDVDVDLHDEPYALVMSFESPKPRSIEKSIKVFQWKNLEECIRRITSRFVLPPLGKEILGEVRMFEHILDVEKQLQRKNRRSKAAKRIDVSPYPGHQGSLEPTDGFDRVREQEWVDEPPVPLPPSLVAAQSPERPKRTTSGYKRRAKSRSIDAVGLQAKKRKIVLKPEAVEPVVQLAASSFDSASTLYSPSSNGGSSPNVGSQLDTRSSHEASLTTTMSTLSQDTVSSPHPGIVHPTFFMRPPVYQHPPAYSTMPNGGPIHPSLVLAPRMILRNPPPYIAHPSTSTLGGAISFTPMIAGTRFVLAPLLAPQPITLERAAFVIPEGVLLSPARESNPSSEIDMDEWLDNDYISALERDT